MGNSGELIDVYDSNTGQVCAQVCRGSQRDTELAIEAASRAFGEWSQTPLTERKACVSRILDEYMKRKDEVSAFLLKELGSPPALAKTQAAMFPFHTKAVLELADSYRWTEPIGRGSVVVKEPVGVVGAISEWQRGPVGHGETIREKGARG